MGIVDAFSKEDRVEVKFSTFYTMMRECAKAELLMNGIKCNVPHRYLREMSTGNSEEPIALELPEAPADEEVQP